VNEADVAVAAEAVATGASSAAIAAVDAQTETKWFRRVPDGFAFMSLSSKS
jgi:hypothetical protein